LSGDFFAKLSLFFEGDTFVRMGRKCKTERRRGTEETRGITSLTRFTDEHLDEVFAIVRTKFFVPIFFTLSKECLPDFCRASEDGGNMDDTHGNLHCL
jgi:hypothetical protein